MKTTYTIFYDTSAGYDWDETYDNLRVAYNRYNKISAPFKSLVETDREHGDRTLINSNGVNNLAKLHCLVEYA